MMSTVEPPSSPQGDDNAQPAPDPDPDDDSAVTPPTYPAYATPPPEGLPDAESG
jgi:hypothetical protein